YLALVLPLLVSGPAWAQPVLGFHEDWSAPPSVSNWGGGAVVTNPGPGGLGGAGDGFLMVARTTTANLGSVSSGPEYVGDWTTSGITQIRLWLKDVGTDDPLEIHLCIGSATSMWEYTVGFAPPNDRWADFTVP